MPAVAALDWMLLAVLLISVLLGLWRGIVYELLSLAAWVVAFVVAQWFGADVAQVLPMAGASGAVRLATGFGLTFVGSLVVMALLAAVAKRLIAAVGLSPLDRLLGAAFGLMRGALVLLATAVVVGLTPLKTSAWWQQSMGAQWLSATLKGLRPVLPAEYAKYLV
jgi:membrane protein required for colicin V production